MTCSKLQKNACTIKSFHIFWHLLFHSSQQGSLRMMEWSNQQLHGPWSDPNSRIPPLLVGLLSASQDLSCPFQPFGDVDSRGLEGFIVPLGIRWGPCDISFKGIDTLDHVMWMAHCQKTKNIGHLFLFVHLGMSNHFTSTLKEGHGTRLYNKIYPKNKKNLCPKPPSEEIYTKKLWNRFGLPSLLLKNLRRLDW